MSRGITKPQLALSVAKGKRAELLALQADYEKRYREHALKFGKDPDDIPRTIYADMIADFVKRLDCEIAEIEGNIPVYVENQRKGLIS